MEISRKKVGIFIYRFYGGPFDRQSPKAKDLDIEELNLNKSEYRSALKNIILEFQTVDWDKADHHEEFQKIKTKFKSSSENKKLLAAELIEWGLGNRYYSDGAKKDKS